MSKNKAIKEFEGCAITQFDPVVIEKFIEYIRYINIKIQVLQFLYI